MYDLGLRGKDMGAFELEAWNQNTVKVACSMYDRTCKPIPPHPRPYPRHYNYLRGPRLLGRPAYPYELAL